MLKGASRIYPFVQWAALALGLVCLVFIRHRIDIGDGGTRLEALRLLVQEHAFGDMAYSYVGPLIALPFYLLGIAPYFNLCVFGTGLLLLAWILRPILSPSELRIFLLLLVFGSLFPFSTKDFYAETLSAVCLGVGSALLVTDAELAAAPWLAIGAANTPALFVPLVLLLGFRCYERKSLAPLWMAGATLLVIAADRWVRFHDVLRSGYENARGEQTFMPFSGQPGFSYPFVLGIASILFSFGKGILFFCPGLWAALPHLTRCARPTSGDDPKRRLSQYWLIVTVGLVIVYAKWWSWYGGQYWGPRFFLFCSLPASLFLASFVASLRDAAATFTRQTCGLLLLLATFWVGFSGLRYGESIPELCRQNNFALEAACWYIPEFSPLFRPLVVHQDPEETLGILTPTWIFGILVVAGPILIRLLGVGETLELLGQAGGP